VGEKQMTEKPQLDKEDLPLFVSERTREWLKELYEYHKEKAEAHSRQRTTSPPDGDAIRDRQRHIFQAHAHDNRAAICKGLLAATDPEVEYGDVTE
jgi:hypothetical protein